MNNHLEAMTHRAAKNAEEARNDKPRLVVGTESKPPPTTLNKARPSSNSNTNKKRAKLALDEIRESLK